MTKWLAYHPRVTAWLFFPFGPIAHVVIFLLELQGPWSSFWYDVKEEAGLNWHSLKKFYRKYPHAVHENLAQYREIYEKEENE